VVRFAQGLRDASAEAVIPEAYRRKKSESGELKLRAKAMLARGTPESRFEAAILLHEAASLERRVLALLDAPSPETRLRSAIEQCGCLVDGLDPTLSAIAWGTVLEASLRVPGEVATALRARIDVAYRAAEQLQAEVVAASPTLLAVDFQVASAIGPAKARAGKEIERWLRHFPGDATIWYLRGKKAMVDDKLGVAWDAIHRAHALRPESSFYGGQLLLLVPWAKPQTEAEASLDGAFASIQAGTADAYECLCFAVASLQASRRSRRPREHWTRALSAALAGPTRAPSALSVPRIGSYFTAVRLVLDELFAERPPGRDALYRAGLGDLAAHVLAAEPRDTVDLLARGVSRAAPPLATAV
jgi:hypothetical protein